MVDANILYHCHTERPQVGHVLGDATVILITRQEVHTHHQVADVHTRITHIHFPYTRHMGHPHSHAPWVGVRSLSQTEKSDILPAYLDVGASLQNHKAGLRLSAGKYK